MNAGLIFYFAHRTLRCQNKIEEALDFYGAGLSDVKICAKKADLSSTMAHLLRTLPFVFVVSDSPESRPGCAAPLFQILHIPVAASGEPKGVLRLTGEEKTGYLIESLNQAIAVLPDEPEELSRMLPAAFERLALKFGLMADFPAEEREPFEEMIESSMKTFNPGV
ncbi:hypothetical protein [Caproiciproducens faecalis]|uniref:Uncharacterized protein n=1 Tax=Caproiciproducens faecalis TaxID=2820301 RepID=A0ABS7DR86_9FIRM|nr:hypothetical protein [Caproiciproducens faecalis]MBW7573091.1 hypothetical protein [Caproiciproducens faecalis]